MRLLCHLSFATVNNWLRSLDLNQNIRFQRPASYQLNDPAIICWSGQQELNPHHALIRRSLLIRQPLYQLSYAPRIKLAATAGVEPAYSRFRNERVYQFRHIARGLVAGVRVELTVVVLMRHTSRPCSIPARKCWRLVVDSHHSLRLFRPTLELSQLPSRDLLNLVAGAGLAPAT